MELLQNGSGLAIFKKILDTLPNSIYLKDIHGRYLWLNKASLKQLRSKHLINDSIIKKTDFDVFPAADAVVYAKNDKKVIETRHGVCVEEEVMLPDGQKLMQLSFKEPLYNEDSSAIVGVLGYTVDITEIKKKEDDLRKEKEKVEAVNKVKQEFLANMRHDFRTPFSGLLSMTQFLASKEDDPVKKERLDIIAESAEILLNDLNEIFEFLQLQNGIPILQKQFSLTEILNEITRIYKPAAEKQETQIELIQHDNLPSYLIGDKFRIKRVLENLISNAIKFTKQGKITIEAKTAIDLGSKLIIKFTIRDTGIGMSEDAYDVIFEPLSRLNPSYSGVYKGKGFGLKLVKTFLDEIEGEIHVNSELGRGTEFKLLIPYKKTLLALSENDL